MSPSFEFFLLSIWAQCKNISRGHHASNRVKLLSNKILSCIQLKISTTFIVNWWEEIGKEFIGKYLTYSICIFPKLQRKRVQVFLPKLQFLGVNRAYFRNKKPDVFTLQFRIYSLNKNPKKSGLTIPNFMSFWGRYHLR